MANISLSGVTKDYEKFRLGPVNLEIKDNEFFGIFGPPSSGKTSILKIILGLLEPSGGVVLIDGKNVAGLGADKRDLAMVFQNLALFPHMTARQNIVFPLEERKISSDKISARLDEVVKVLHIAHILHKVPALLSGGERQRVALGRAFVREPKAFLLDEPIAALDARLREEMRVELKRLQRENRHTFVYVSHDEEEVLSIADRVAIVIGGEIVQVGTPDEIYDFPNSIPVATLVGSPPMNIFEGQLEGTDARFRCDLHGLNFSVGSLASEYRGNAKLGVRPEHFTIAASAGQGVSGNVMAVEPLGAFTILDIDAKDQVIKVRIPGQLSFAMGDAVGLTFDPAVTHIFNNEGCSVARIAS